MAVAMIAELLGIPPERDDDSRRWSDASTLRFPPDSLSGSDVRQG